MDGQTLELANTVTAWHESVVTQMKLLQDSGKTVKLQSSDPDAPLIEVTGEMLKGLRLGMTLSLDLIKELPFKLTKTED